MTLPPEWVGWAPVGFGVSSVSAFRTESRIVSLASLVALVPPPCLTSVLRQHPTGKYVMAPEGSPSDPSKGYTRAGTPPDSRTPPNGHEAWASR